MWESRERIREAPLLLRELGTQRVALSQDVSEMSDGRQVKNG